MGKKFKEMKRRILSEIFVVTLTTLCIILAIFGLPIFLLLLLYRLFVVTIAKFCRPELTHTLGTTSLFAYENVTERAKANIIICLIFEGDISQRLEEIHSLFTSRVLDKVDEKGRLVYPELRQIWTSFMGYFFWKNEAHFDIKEHIRIYDCDCKLNDGLEKKTKEKKIYTDEDLKQVATGLLSEPWKRDFSPWELLIIPKYSDDSDKNDRHSNVENNANHSETGKSVMMLRFHHSMGDGKGWFDILFSDFFKSKNIQLPQETSPKKPKWWQSLLIPIKLPYDFIKNTVESRDRSKNPSKNPWHTPEKRAKKYLTTVTPPIPTQLIKDLKNKYGVSYAAILICAISGGIGRVMEQAGQNAPKKMKAAMVLPMSNHPGKICLHASFVNLCWPIGTEDPVVRLEEIRRDMKSKRNSLYPLAFHLLIRLGSILPNFVLRLAYNQALVSIFASLFPGTTQFPTFLGCTVVDSMSFFGLPPGQFGASVTSCAVGGNQRITVTVDQSLFPSQVQLETFGGFIEEELLKLETGAAESFSSRCKRVENIV